MSDKQKAEDLAEQAIETAMEGDVAKARDMAEQAKSIDIEVVSQVAEDADAEHAAAAKYAEKSVD